MKYRYSLESSHDNHLPDPLSDNPDLPFTGHASSRCPKIYLVYSATVVAAASAIPIDMLQRFAIVPFGLDDEFKVVSIACANPGDLMMIRELAGYFPKLRIDFYAADPNSIRRLIDRLLQCAEQHNRTVPNASVAS